MRKPNRWVVLAAAALTGGGTGSLQMWSIFNRPLIDAYGWQIQEVSLVFSLVTLAGCCAGFLAGRLQRAVRPSLLMLVAGSLYGLGWLLAGFVDTVPMLYLTFGFIGGAGNGLIYNTAIAIAVKWFPDKRGIANGVVLGGTGLAPVFFAPYGNFLIENLGVSAAFKAVGLTLIVLYVAFAWILRWPDGEFGNTAEVRDTHWLRHEHREYRTSEMLRSGRFWMIWCILACAATSGTMMIGHAANIGQELAGLSAGEAAWFPRRYISRRRATSGQMVAGSIFSHPFRWFPQPERHANFLSHGRLRAAKLLLGRGIIGLGIGLGEGMP